MDVLTNPYFLGYVLIILLLIRLGNGMKHVYEERVRRRRQAKEERPDE